MAEEEKKTTEEAAKPAPKKKTTRKKAAPKSSLSGGTLRRNLYVRGLGHLQRGRVLSDDDAKFIEAHMLKGYDPAKGGPKPDLTKWLK